MRIGLVVDATCDLPPDFIERHGIGILPIHIRIGGRRVTDARDPQATLAFYGDALGDSVKDAETIPYSAEEIHAEFLKRFVIEYDHVMALTVTSTRSPIFENAQQAAFSILNDYKAVRDEHGLEGIFSIRVVDSQTLFSGTAVLAAEAARMIADGSSHSDVRRRIEALREHVTAYLVPADLGHIRTRAKAKGEKSVGLMTFAIGSALDIKPIIQAYRGETAPIAKVRHFDNAVTALFEHAARQIEAGVHARYCCLSYGGDPAVIPTMPGYQTLAAAADANDVEILHSIMSATAAVNAGGGALALALAADPRPFDR